MRIHTLLLLVVITAALFTASCKKDDNNTEEELITKVEVHLVGVGSSFDKNFEAEDPDGDGIWNTIPSVDIPANTVFNVQVHVYDGDQEINDEIAAEKNDHLFTYQVTGANLTVSDRDLDNDGKPFGLGSKWTTGATSTGNLQIKLHHEPTDKNAADPGGEIDFDVTFLVKVQ